MLPELTSKLVEELWSDIRNTSTPPLLAHYTSVATLEQMMKNDEIWFSNPLYMNDLEELRFGMNEGAAAFRTSENLRKACADNECHAKLIYYFDYLFNEFDSKHAFDTYVMCLAQHAPDNNDGILSMWRGYGANGSGVAIVFDTAKAQETGEFPLIVDKVHYASPDERRQWINDKVERIAQFVSSNELDDTDLHAIAHYWIERLKLFALFTKHSGFREEGEWRIVYLSERDTNKKLKGMLGYAITGRGAEPKLKLKVKPLDGTAETALAFETLIDRIILGPSISTTLAAMAVGRILEMNGKSALMTKIVASTIPFRP
jgi:hypothetical protein